jgi:hypothetical protein
VGTAGYNLDAYERLIQLALAQNYRFVAFDSPREDAEKRILLRHDVDYSLSMAVELARVNARHGVAATFCLLLRGQVYNLLSRWSLGLAGELHDLGQHVGLHFVAGDAGGEDLDALAAAVVSDCDLLRATLPNASAVFSWHNPAPGLMAMARDWCPRGLVNAYHRHFVADIPYYSDSNFRNSCADFERVLGAGHATMQLLFHPINWVAGGESMVEVFSRAWPFVLREREEEFLTNRVYQAVFPDGMPQTVLARFSRHWLHEARKAAR